MRGPVTRVAPLPGRSFERPLLTLGLLLLFLLAMLAFAHPAAADGIIIPRPPRDRPVIPWRDIPLTVKYHRVDVTITDQVATTRVDQVFVNNAAYPVEGTYIFPLPEDAAVSSFDMWVDGRKLEGKLLGRDEARRIYEDIVRQQRDPALLEYVGRGAFQASIFPIPAGGERRIQLSYSQVLSRANGLVHYRYPLNTEKFSARPLSEVAVTVTVEDKAPLRALYSPSHTVDIARDGERRATVSYEARDIRPDRDFDLYYSVSEDAIAVNLLSYKPFDEDGYFVLLVAPPIEAAADKVIAKDVVLVLDTSGSMDGEKIRQAQDAATFVLDHLNPDDRFNIVAFSTATRLFADRPVPIARRAEGREFIRRLIAQGSTDINRALLEGLAGVDGKRPTVLIFLTDGLPTAGETDPDRIVANVQSNAAKTVRLFAFGVGYDVDTVLLDQLSANQRGASSYVAPNEKIDENVSEFYAKVSAPVLVDVGLKLPGATIEEVYPYPLPDLFAGSQLVVTGRYRTPGTTTLTLTGTVDGKAQTYTYRNLTFVNRGGNEFIPRLWAQRKIGYLLTQIRLQGAQGVDTAELIDEVVSLSTRFGIVTPYTSFLVEEPGMTTVRPGDRLPPVGGAGGGAAPAAEAPADTGRSGEAAVAKAQTESAMRSADQAAAPEAGSPESEVLKHVGDKTFRLLDGAWVDTAFDAAQMQPEQVIFGSDRYFALLRQLPELGRYLALGDRVTVVLNSKAYAIVLGK